MAQYATLKAAIDAVIKANGQREITGTVLNQTLNAMVNSLGANYQLAGVATPSTNPGTPDQNVFYLAFEAGTYTNFNATVLSAGISILMWNGSWSSQTFYTIDATPTASSNNLVSSGAVFDAIKTDGSAYDVSAHFPTAGPNNDGKFTLDYILNNANTLIPAAWRKGGMSIRFVQSSDNKYVQFRCIADEFTTDTTQWAIAEEGIYMENPEFVYVKTDAEGKILWAIKIDGNIYYGAGVPQQVIEYINEKIEELSLDEYEDIVAFLNGLEQGDKTLQTLLNEKVDKEEGKSLIDGEYASSQSVIENPEFLEVTTDSEDKVLEGIKTDGTKVIEIPLETQGVRQETIDNPEWIKVNTDSEGKIISGIKINGDIVGNWKSFDEEPVSNRNKITITAILRTNVSNALSNGEYGYEVLTNKIVYKNSSGNVITINPLEFYGTDLIYNGFIFVTDISTGILVLKNTGDTIPIRNFTGIPSGAKSGFYLNPAGTQIVFASETTDYSTGIGLIRTNATGFKIGNADLSMVYSDGEWKVEDNNLPAMANFDVKDDLKDFTGQAEVLPFDGHVLLTKLYEKMDELVALYPNFITKVDVMDFVAAEMADMGVTDYPRYAKGVAAGDAEYLETPAYRTYLYIFKSGEDRWGNNQINKHKKVLLISGTHGYEKASQINCYNFAKQLCNPLADSNYFALRNCCDFYIVPTLCGYGLYHGLRTNGNGVNINRNYDCKDGFVEATTGIYDDYTGPEAFSEFESKIVKCLTEKLNPDICIDHHSYTKVANPNVGKYQIFYGDIQNAVVGRSCYQAAIDFSFCMEKHYPDDFVTRGGTGGNILINNSASLAIPYTGDAQTTDAWWYNMKNIKFALCCEVSHDIMYDHGVPLNEDTTWTATDKIFTINEYYLRITLIRLLQTIFNHL